MTSAVFYLNLIGFFVSTGERVLVVNGFARSP